MTMMAGSKRIGGLLGSVSLANSASLMAKQSITEAATSIWQSHPTFGRPQLLGTLNNYAIAELKPPVSDGAPSANDLGRTPHRMFDREGVNEAILNRNDLFRFQVYGLRPNNVIRTWINQWISHHSPVNKEWLALKCWPIKAGVLWPTTCRQ
jgi:hypothetical protein